MAIDPVMLMKESPIFAGLSAETLDLFLTKGVWEDHAEGDYFFREGDDGKSMYVLLEGCASVYKRS